MKNLPHLATIHITGNQMTELDLRELALALPEVDIYGNAFIKDHTESG